MPASGYYEQHPWLWRCTVACGVTGVLLFIPAAGSSGGEQAGAIVAGLALIALCIAALALTSNWHIFGPLEWWKKCIAGSAVLMGVVSVIMIIIAVALVWFAAKVATGAVGGAVGYDD